MNDDRQALRSPSDDASASSLEQAQIFGLTVAWLAHCAADSDMEAAPIRAWLFGLGEAGVDVILGSCYETVAEYVWNDFRWSVGGSFDFDGQRFIDEVWPALDRVEEAWRNAN